MEKLQAALEKAREKRGETAAATGDETPGKRDRTVSKSAVEQRWAELRPLEVNQKALRKNRVFFRSSKENDAASFDVLRTKVLLQMEKNGWRRLAVTSPGSGAGKSTVCANLASSIARQEAIRAVVMDFDMRRPSLSKIFGVDPKGTVADVLNAEMAFSEHAERLGPNVALSLNAAPVKDPSDLFLLGSTASCIDRIETDYKPDIMVFDVPPMFVNDDATAFFTNVDCVLIVIDAERNNVTDVDRCEKEVAEHANVLGMVLNKCRYPEESYGYGGYGKNY